MGLTIVLSGSVNTRTQAIAALQSAGFAVDPKDENGHGFPPGDGIGYITANGGSLEIAQQVVAHLNWELRSHWMRSGPWQKVPGTGSPVEVPDPLRELERLKAQLRAQGIKGV